MELPPDNALGRSAHAVTVEGDRRSRSSTARVMKKIFARIAAPLEKNPVIV
jgi:hypothetical protein